MCGVMLSYVIVNVTYQVKFRYLGVKNWLAKLMLIAEDAI
jgi:hypothetical protein